MVFVLGEGEEGYLAGCIRNLCAPIHSVEINLRVLVERGEGMVFKKSNLLPDLLNLGDTYTLMAGMCLENSL